MWWGRFRLSVQRCSMTDVERNVSPQSPRPNELEKHLQAFRVKRCRDARCSKYPACNRALAFQCDIPPVYEKQVRWLIGRLLGAAAQGGRSRERVKG